MALGLVASLIGIYMVRAKAGETDALKAINRGIGVAQALAIVGRRRPGVRLRRHAPRPSAAASSP